MSNNIEEDIKICKDFIDENRERPIILHKAIENILADRGEKEKYISQIANMLNIAEDQIPIELAVQLTKANAYDSLVEKIKESLNKKKKEYEEILSDYGNIDTDITFNIPNKNVKEYLDNLVIEIMLLQELLDTENSFQEGEI